MCVVLNFCVRICSILLISINLECGSIERANVVIWLTIFVVIDTINVILNFGTQKTTRAPRRNIVKGKPF